MAEFLPAYNKTSLKEGGWSLLKGDNGGETYVGISRVYWPKWAGWPIIDAYKKKLGKIKYGTRFKELEPLVADFYLKNVFIANKVDQIQNQDLANFVFDMLTTHGKASYLVNKAINIAYGKTVVPLRNAISAATIATLNSNPALVYANLIPVRKEYFKTLEDWPIFGKGWINRVNSFPQQIFTGASGSDDQKKK